MSDELERLLSNAEARNIRALGRDPRERQDSGQYLIEGSRSLEGVIRAGGSVQRVIAGSEANIPASLLDALGVEVLRADDTALARMATTKSAPQVIAVAEFPERAAFISVSTLVACDVGDPGNLGTIIRLAAAFHWNVVLVGDCVDPFNPKCVRSSAGAVAAGHVQVGTDLETVVATERRSGSRIIGTAVSQGNDLFQADLAGRVSVLVGSEAKGLSEDELGLCDEVLTIPVDDLVESLNVGLACAILVGEAARQARK